MSIKYGRIITDNRAMELDRLFTYKIEEDMLDYIEEGMRVIIPFGQGNRVIKGLLVEIVDEYEGDYKLKSIIDVIDDKPIISENLLELSRWIRKEYISSYNSSLQLILPPGDFKKVETFIDIIDKEYISNDENEKKIINHLIDNGEILLSDLKKDLNIVNINKYLNDLEDRSIIDTSIDITTSVKKKKERWIILNTEDYDLDKIKDIIGNRAFKQIEIAEYLYKNNDKKVNDILKELDTGLSVIRELENKGVAKIYNKVVERQAIKRDIDRYEKHELNIDQEIVYNTISYAMDNDTQDDKFLIHGVTGSGKTEVYLHLVEKMIDEGKDSIILVPEISLTPQTIDRFVGRFGEDVAILHSRLSHGERFDQWRKIKEGKVKIAVGARSAVFAPFNNLGMIIIDEEHENSYKSSNHPKYDTVQVASKRIEIENAILVLGTATPSLDTYIKTKDREIVLLEMNKRVKDIKMPDVQLIDMRKELELGNRSIFSKALYDGIEAALEDKKQIILFLNRRGYSTFVSCRECGYVVECDNCDISMTYHRNVNRLRCHYCGETKRIPIKCPECNSKYIKYFGIGTEQIEDITRKSFPDARIARMDGDTTTKKGSYDRILGAMKNKEIDILIGTQMISKGLDFENVVLVGIITADTALNIPDFRSPEKTFQLITQVAGRAGRGKHEGQVVLQTYEPDHYSIVHAKNQDYKSFIEEELPLREMFLYPPYIKLISLLIYGEDRNKIIDISQKIYNLLGSYIYNIHRDDYYKYIIGPNPAPLERIKNNFRYQIILKSEFDTLEKLKGLLYRICISNHYKLDLAGVNISIDIDPITIL